MIKTHSRCILTASLAVALAGCKAKTSSQVAQTPTLQEAVNKGDPVVVSALKGTVFFGEKNFSCEVKSGTQLQVRKISSPSTNLQGYALMSDKEFLLVDMQSDFQKLFDDSRRFYKIDASGSTVPCGLTKGYLLASDFEVWKGQPQPPVTNTNTSVATNTGTGTGTAINTGTGTGTAVQTAAPLPMPAGSVTAGQGRLVAPTDTFFKKAEGDSSAAAPDTKCAVPLHTEIAFQLRKASNPEHLGVTLITGLTPKAEASYCATGAVGYIHAPTFAGSGMKLFSVRNTVFKAAPVESTTGLTAAQKCAFNGEVFFKLLGLENTAGIGLHIKGTLLANIATGDGSAQCASGTTGYLFLEHFAAQP